MNPPDLSTARRIVIKTGSALVAEGGAPRTPWLGALAAGIARLRAEGKQVLLVSSGAIALGRSALGRGVPKKLEDKQAAAAFGQPLLINALAAAFAAHSIRTAQSLLTLEDTENRRRWLNARATLQAILASGGLPVINENDTVATDEIRYGDNDRLAARVAQMVSADLLVLLSDIDGLYTEDPRRSAAAVHIPHLDTIGPEHEAMAGGANGGTGVGSGGMATKLAAAKIAYGAGCATVIADGGNDDPLAGLHGTARSTWIIPALSPDRARAIWLASHLKPEGAVTVDTGAAKALRTGASLLPVGISSVSGQFERGAAVDILDADGSCMARGVTAYSAADIARIMGRRSEEVEAVLGFKGRPAVVHRDDMVLDPR